MFGQLEVLVKRNAAIFLLKEAGTFGFHKAVKPYHDKN